MKYCDYIYYSKLMNKKNKKESNFIIFGLSFSLIMFFSFICIFISFFSIDFSINKEHNISSIYFNYSYIDDDMEFLDSYGTNYIEEKIYYNKFNIPGYIIKNGFNTTTSISPTFFVEDKKYEFDLLKLKKEGIDISFSLIAYNGYDKIFLDSEKEYMNKNLLGDVILAGSGFTDSINEIMISSDFLDFIGINNYDTIIGKYISCETKISTSNREYFLKNNDEYVDITSKYYDYVYYPFSSYKIIGVFNTNIYKCPSRYATSNQKNFDSTLMDPIFWVKYASLVPTNQSYYKNPDNNSINSNKIVFEKDLEEIFNEAYRDNKIIVNTSLGEFNNGKNNLLIQFKNINCAYVYSMNLSNQNDNIVYDYNGQINYNMKSYFDFYPFFSFINFILFFSIVSVFIVVILNIIRIQEYSFHKNLNFYTINISMGMSLKDITNICLFKNYLNLLKSVLFSIMVLIPICVLIHIGFNAIFQSDTYNYYNWINYEIKWNEIVLLILAVIIFIFILLYIISLLLVFAYKNKIYKVKLD